MTHHESAIDEIATRLHGVDASMTMSPPSPTSWRRRCSS